jgi:uncharacterized protein YgiB involved in biofilm formation
MQQRTWLRMNAKTAGAVGRCVVARRCAIRTPRSAGAGRLPRVRGFLPRRLRRSGGRYARWGLFSEHPSGGGVAASLVPGYAN